MVKISISNSQIIIIHIIVIIVVFIIYSQTSSSNETVAILISEDKFYAVSYISADSLSPKPENLLYRVLSPYGVEASIGSLIVVCNMVLTN